jgi:hypothetical protein
VVNVRLVGDTGYYLRGASHLVLTKAVSIGNLGCMASSPQRLDPERRRRRLELLAALADAKSARELSHPQRLRGARIRELIANRRRFGG